MTASEAVRVGSTPASPAMKKKKRELIIKSVDSLNLPWTGNRMERLLFNSLLYKWCSYRKGHWVLQSNFGSSTNREDELDYRCKNCRNHDQRGRKARNKLKPILLEKQDYMCDLCDKDLRYVTDPNHVVTDHNNETDQTRGVICHNCNIGLGRFDDDKELLKKAIKYLERHEEE